MIGNVMQAAVEPPRGEVSTKLVDALAQIQRPAPALLVPEGARTIADLDLWFSASDAHLWCPRLYALAVRDRVPVRDPVDADLLWTFAVGTGYHRAFQDELLPHLGSVLQGAWEPEDGVWPDPRPTPTMGPGVERGWYPRPPEGYWRFREPKGRIPALRLVGKWDAVLGWADAPHEVWELKSIREDLLVRVDPRMGGSPWAKHLLQMQVYLWLSGLSWGRLVYVPKSGAPLRGGMVEHVVPRDEVTIRELQATLAACVTAVDGVLAGAAALPAKLGACRIKSDARARGCPFKDRCFAAAKAAA